MLELKLEFFKCTNQSYIYLFFAVIVPFASAHTERRLFQSNIFKMDPQVNIVQICPWDNFKCFLKLNLDQDYSKNTFLA